MVFNHWRNRAVILFAAAAVFSGCRFAPIPPSTYIPPVFDPTGTWYGENASLIGAEVDYSSFIAKDGVEYGCRSEYYFGTGELVPACSATTTGAFWDGFDANTGAGTFFGAGDAFTTLDTLGHDLTYTPAVLATSSSINLLYTASTNTAYVNLNGTGAYSRDALPIAATADYYTIQAYPNPGAAAVVGTPFLESAGCYAMYSAYLSLRIPNSNEMDGILSSRFEFANTDGWDAANPSCDEFFAVFQSDWDIGAFSYENDGLLFPLVFGTTFADGVTAGAALDVINILFISAFQFNTTFWAERTSRFTSHHDGTDRDHTAEISSDFIRQGLRPADAFMAWLQGHRARIMTLVGQVRASNVVRDGRLVAGNSFPRYSDVVARATVQANIARAVSGRGTAAPAAVPGH